MTGGTADLQGDWGSETRGAAVVDVLAGILGLDSSTTNVDLCCHTNVACIIRTTSTVGLAGSFGTVVSSHHGNGFSRSGKNRAFRAKASVTSLNDGREAAVASPNVHTLAWDVLSSAPEWVDINVCDVKKRIDMAGATTKVVTRATEVIGGLVILGNGSLAHIKEQAQDEAKAANRKTRHDS